MQPTTTNDEESLPTEPRVYFLIRVPTAAHLVLFRIPDSLAGPDSGEGEEMQRACALRREGIAIGKGQGEGGGRGIPGFGAS